ncbi:3-ketoacyl-ACP reductase [Paenibacillus darwinianus]|uniref:3-ketoacyl-ACP reductase n=1 Tax=Paenibacillus darwinianus TaxID=1380763 RepID=A0A9W5S0D6_9BACL|nr:SDR family NAD(P)-dependent oxidoreductase [Paenibacillus darwinianus]EXX86025.1 3-ketoacyl-ACP reductase [Paenibacillus darwinianus]EXX86156.1 3-ketoacyl-ACP reductase [Paenibacillus darwinianus]EXX86485.1 3-ketoacyl-ACP reductase [Paenibacillus darwinianus]
MAKRVHGKVAVITGAGSGIGKAAAELLAREGAKVALIGITKDKLKQVEQMIAAAGGEALAVHADITSEADIHTAYEKVLHQWERLDIVFANAGINGTVGPIETMAFEEWNRTILTNLTGTFLTVKHAIPSMKNKGGSIIITSSINGNRVFTSFGMSAYSTTKAGQVAYMKMAALELARYRIRVNAVCPGAIETNIDDSTEKKPDLKDITIPVEMPPEGEHPLRRAPGTASQVAKLVLFLASDESDHVSGTEIYIDGAESLIH